MDSARAYLPGQDLLSLTGQVSSNYQLDPLRVSSSEQHSYCYQCTAKKARKPAIRLPQLPPSRDIKLPPRMVSKCSR